MHYLLFAAALLFFIFIAPVKVTVAVFAQLLLVTAVVKLSAQMIAGTVPSVGEAFKAVFYSTLLVIVGLFTVMSFASGTGLHHIGGSTALIALAGLFIAYVLGFQIGLGTSFGASAVIAVISTLASGAVLWSLRSISL